MDSLLFLLLLRRVPVPVVTREKSDVLVTPFFGVGLVVITLVLVSCDLCRPRALSVPVPVR